MNDLISYFPRVTGKSGTPVTLQYWLEQTKHPTRPDLIVARDTILKIRQSTDPKEVKALKKELPGVAPGCLISPDRSRKHYNISNLTGWMQLDIDCVEDSAAIRNEVAKISYIAYCSISASGSGIWALVRVEKPELSKRYFRQLAHDLKKRGIQVDLSKGGNPTDFRFYSYDENAIIKSDYKVYDRLPSTELVPDNPSATPKHKRPPSVFQKAYEYVRNKGFHFRTGDMHNSVFNLCCYLNKAGMPREEAEYWIDQCILPLSAVTTNCITYPYQHYASQHGTWKQVPKSPSRQP